MNWRRLNNVLHRDIGYLAVGLTIVYGVSGIAVNHVRDWNPSYRVDKVALTIEPISATDRAVIIAEARQKLGVTQEPRNAFRPDPDPCSCSSGTGPTRSTCRRAASFPSARARARCSSSSTSCT